jgi:hypothetical protein
MQRVRVVKARDTRRYSALYPTPGSNPSLTLIVTALQVDFCGNTVKALDLSQVLNAMRIVGRDVAALADPYELFRLDAATQLQPPKWGAANDWSPVDDSMLLLGCYLHGIGSWERLAADARLGLADKLAGAVKDGPKANDKSFPQGAPCGAAAATVTSPRWHLFFAV